MKNTQIYPVIKIGDDYFSTNNTTFEGNYCTPILLNIPSIKQSVDIESRKFKISNVSLDLSNFPVSGERFSDRLSTSSLINTEVVIYFVQHDTSEEVYRGQIRRILHDDEKVKIELEDLTEKKIQKELPQRKQKDYFKSDFRYVPMVYGSVDKSPTLPTSTQGYSFNIGSISHSLLFDGNRNIGYKLGDDLRLKIDYKEIEGFDEYKVNGQGFYNPLFLYENGKYHRVLESAQKTLITDEEGTNLYKVFSQYSTPEGYIENYIDINSRFDSDSDDPSENNFKNLPSSGIVQCYKKQKFSQWNINIPYQAPSLDSPAQGFFLSPQNPLGESNELSISGTIETDLNLDFPYDNQVFDNCLIKFKIDEVPSISDSKIFTYYNPRLSIGLSSMYSFRVVFNIYDSNGDIKNSGSGTLIPTQSSVGTYEYYIDEYNLDYETTDDKSFSISAFEWAVVDTYTTSGTVVNLTSTINDFDIYNIYNLNFIDKNFYVDVKGRINTFDDHPEPPNEDFIQNPIDIIYDILRNELGLTAEQINEDDYTEARDAHDGWKFAFTVNKKTNSKKLIEKIAKSTKCLPHFKNDGTFGFNTIKDSYTQTDIDNGTPIKEKEVINYSFKKTKPEDIVSEVGVKYKKDYAQDLYSRDVFTYIESTYAYNKYDEFYNYPDRWEYYGIENPEDAFLEVESDYIRDDETAYKLRQFLFDHHKNEHLIFNVKLPISYNQLEVGDLVKFDKLFGGIKAYGIDYTQTIPINGQARYPLFMITSTKKNLDSIEIECIQLHHLDGEMEQIEGGDIIGAGTQDDTEAPVITISGDINVEQGETFDLPTYSVSDNFDENPTIQASYNNQNKINVNVDGTATAVESGVVNFQVFAEDSAGNQTSAFSNINISSNFYTHNFFDVDGWYMGSIMSEFADAYDGVPEGVQVNSNQFWFGIKNGLDNTAISTQLNSQSPAALAAEELISELQKHIGHHNALYGTQFKGAVQVEGMENPEDDGLYGINVYASPMPQNWDWEIFILWFDNIILFTKITADIYKAEANEQTLIESGASSFDTSIGHTYIQNVHAQSHQLDYTEITGTNGWNEPFTPAWVNHPYYSDPNEGEGSNEPSRELTLRLVPLNPIPPLEGFLGDMNGDSFINVLDIVIVVQTILGSEVFGEGYGMLDYDNYPPHFDFNQDGFLNILDIVSLVNFILEDG